jgi:hypothetical protein
MDKKMIARMWTHAFEEDAEAGAKVFRPSEGKFPLSRGREKLDLSNAVGIRSTIGPDDRNKETKSQWTFDQSEKTLSFMDHETKSAPIVYDIVSLTSERMILRRR